MDDNLDNIAKGMLSNSSMKVFDSTFNYKIMAQISIEAQRKVRRKLLFGYCLVSMGVLVSGYISLKILNIDMFQLFSALEISSKNFFTILNNYAFMLATIVLLIVVFVNLRRSAY